jgi:hypothetical protein
MIHCQNLPSREIQPLQGKGEDIEMDDREQQHQDEPFVKSALPAMTFWAASRLSAAM